jgi:hypothetical protein
MPLHAPVGVQQLPPVSHSWPLVQLLVVHVVLLPEHADTGPWPVHTPAGHGAGGAQHATVPVGAGDGSSLLTVGLFARPQVHWIAG